MALELAEQGITVNSVAPGEIATPMTGQPDGDPHAEERPGIPAGRPGDAREIAAAIAYLCSPEASYTTGASFVVDGGMLLMAAMATQPPQYRPGGAAAPPPPPRQAGLRRRPGRDARRRP